MADIARLESERRVVGSVLLEKAGVTPALIRRTVKRISEALDARKVQRIKLTDDSIRAFHDVDHQKRLEAADRVVDLASRCGLIPESERSLRAVGAGTQIALTVIVQSESGPRVVQVGIPAVEGENATRE